MEECRIPRRQNWGYGKSVTQQKEIMLKESQILSIASNLQVKIGYNKQPNIQGGGEGGEGGE